MTTILDELDPESDYFEAAQGLYWYCANWHGGQSSELYSILSAQLHYEPAQSEIGPDNVVAQMIYEALEAGKVDASTVLAFVNAGCDERHGTI